MYWCKEKKHNPTHNTENCCILFMRKEGKERGKKKWRMCNSKDHLLDECLFCTFAPMSMPTANKKNSTYVQIVVEKDIHRTNAPKKNGPKLRSHYVPHLQQTFSKSRTTKKHQHQHLNKVSDLVVSKINGFKRLFLQK